MNTELWQVMILETASAFAITVLLAVLSYRFLELPFLRLKDRFSKVPIEKTNDAPRAYPESYINVLK